MFVSNIRTIAITRILLPDLGLGGLHIFKILNTKHKAVIQKMLRRLGPHGDNARILAPATTTLLDAK